MLNTINVKNVASFDSTGITLNNLSKINFIYGSNGSGKTTISNYLIGESPDKYKNCNLVWDGNQPLDTLVYNKTFREKNFGKSTIEGVFTLGQSTTEELAIIDKKKEELEKLRLDGISKKSSLDTLEAQIIECENLYKEKFWSAYFKKYETKFRIAFTGSAQKESFKARLLKQQAQDNISIEDLEKRADIVFIDAPSPVDVPSLLNLPTCLSDGSIWQRKVIGKQDIDIAKLITTLGLDDWLHQGLKYVHGNTCPFCQQETITENFRLKISEYFDDTYKKSMTELNGAANDYRASLNHVNQYLSDMEMRLSRNTVAKIDIESFRIASSAVISLLSSNMELILNKLKEPSLAIDIHPFDKEWSMVTSLIKQAMDRCIEHNQIVAQYGSERTKLIHDVWGFIAQQAKEEISEYRTALNGKTKGRDNVARILAEKREEYAVLNSEIKQLVSQTTSVQPAVDEINAVLRGCGFNSFEIIPAQSVPNHYQINRPDGSLAEPTLSEGEVSFITLLYFLQLAKGGKSATNVSSPRILVIDDPISSLDSGILFVVSTLIKSLIKSIKAGTGDIRQLILLTHNVYFHKEVSFIDGRTKSLADVNYWIIRKGERFSSAIHYGIHNPISTSYELLWREYKETPDTSAITLQNIMRRIIENYFKILGKYGDDDLIAKFTTHEDREVCRSLVAWINDGSHCIPDDLFIQAHGAEIDVYKRVFKEIFKLTEHEAHYEMMTREV